MTAVPPEGLLTVREVAEAIRVSAMTVYRLIKAGDLPAIRVGTHLRIRRRELDAYLDARVVGGDHSPGRDLESGHEQEDDRWPAA